MMMRFLIIDIENLAAI